MLRKQKTGQIQSGELIIVVMIVMVMLIVGLALYTTVRGVGIKESRSELASLEAVDLAQEAASLQELSCGFSVETGSECIDLFRLEAFYSFYSQIQLKNPGSEEYSYFRSKFGPSMIKIERIYPNYKEWILFNHSLVNVESSIPLRMPLIVYDPLQKTRSFAIMTVVKYS